MEQDAYSKYMNDLENSSPSRMERAAETLRSLGHKMAVIPGINFITLLLPVPLLLTGLAAGMDSLGAVMRGRVVEGVKNAMAGGVDTVTTGLTSWAYTFGVGPVFWLGSAFSGVATGDTLPEVFRKATKAGLDTLTGEDKQPDPLTLYARQHQVIGMNPQTIGATTAGIGYAPAMQPQMAMTAPPAAMMPGAQPGLMPDKYWTNTIAQQRGQNPNEARQRWMSAQENQQSYRELLAARQQQAQQLPLQGQGV